MPRQAPAGPTPGPVAISYDGLVARGALRPDPAQRAAAAELDAIVSALAAPQRNALLARFGRKTPPVRGAYIHGAVGRGKTMLMDLFFAAAPLKAKRRVHFHEFMDEVHGAIAAFRARAKAAGDDTDPIEAVTRPIARAVRLICLDEFHVNDIADAMLLNRLFAKLFARGVVLVATSNFPPEKLYLNGLNRDLFLPFIALLEAHARILPLPAAMDYRREKFAGQEVYAFGEGADERMDRLWLRITGGEPGAPSSLESIGRTIPVPLASMGAARFGFADLCEAPLGPRDFVRIAQEFDSVMIENVPVFTRTRSDAARRFIVLIDCLYDRGVKLAASFAAPLDALGEDERTGFEFERTVSRLIEMQSGDYLGAPLRAPGAEAGAAPSA